ncbi:DUF5753 domain-containing protein [Streptomyces sp. NPDC021354]|uniref:DUF5753 domain-containing protein n=1 Tax=Streptomyces sp. NPDC021354 TaxID=3154793 RepID=UPI0033E636D5
MIRIPSASKLWAVINEAAIRHHVCSTEVVRQQLERLAHASEHPRITIQFLPFAAGAHAGLYGSFMVMDFPTPTPEVVRSENLTNSVCFVDPEDVDRYIEVFDQLRDRALGIQLNCKGATK